MTDKIELGFSGTGVEKRWLLLDNLTDTNMDNHVPGVRTTVRLYFGAWDADIMARIDKYMPGANDEELVKELERYHEIPQDCINARLTTWNTNSVKFFRYGIEQFKRQPTDPDGRYWWKVVSPIAKLNRTIELDPVGIELFRLAGYDLYAGMLQDLVQEFLKGLHNMEHVSFGNFASGLNKVIEKTKQQQIKQLQERQAA